MWMAGAAAIISSGRGPVGILPGRMLPGKAGNNEDYIIMIKLSQIKLKAEQVNLAKRKEGGLQLLLNEKVCRVLHIDKGQLQSCEILRESLDARKKPDIYYSYTCQAVVSKEETVYTFLCKHARHRGEAPLCVNGIQITREREEQYHFPQPGKEPLQNPILIVGSGPAGLFCAYFLALHGYQPLVLERGKCVEERQQDVENFWKKGILCEQSNVQFGEGGAGTFSDGKLNTLVKDKYGRNRQVLKTFVENGACPSILYEAKPHIGTDVLCNVVKNMRQKIIELGGEFLFQNQVTDLKIQNGRIAGVEVNHTKFMECDALVLATGHSARDTFQMLYERKLQMEAKPFAVGVRVEHPQKMINEIQYGPQQAGQFPVAAYKVTAKTTEGRGVYSFCMCPGGYVVNASSEPGRLAVNGMSYSGRNGKNANSAIIVTVDPGDFSGEHPLAGMEFQRRLEEKAFQLAGGRIPMQRYHVFKACVEAGKRLEELDSAINVDTGMFLSDNSVCEVTPEHKGESAWADVSAILPESCNRALVEGMEKFAGQIPGFNRPDAILSGVESRTSSPLRIERDETLQANIRGIYPCGEGAGYAGGITSAAMDGIRIAEQLAALYAPSVGK